MSSTNVTTTSTPTVVPLARDEQGRQIPVPPDAAFWRVRRHTRGRPRNVAGADRQPLRLPLDFTEADLEAMFGAGTYRLDLCDAAGESLDVTATVSLGDDEPPVQAEAASIELAPMTALPASASDVRFVLEANVRATQLAFTHNERTLTASLRMADTLRDGLRDLANAQASWITAIASARGFFRNGAPALQLPVAQMDSEEEADVNETDEPARPDWVELAQPLVATITDSVVKAIMNRGAKNDGGGQGFQLRDALDWRRAAKKAEANALSGGETSPSMEHASEQLQRKAMEVFSRLDTPEQARLLALVPKLAGRAGDPEMQQLAAELLPLPPDEAAVWVRAHLDDIERRFAS